MADFGDRRQFGVQNLATDGRAIADHLDRAIRFDVTHILVPSNFHTTIQKGGNSWRTTPAPEPVDLIA